MWNVSRVCVCYGDAPWILSGLRRSKPWSNPSVINSPLSYTNMLIIHVWENTDKMTSVYVN